MRKRSSPGAGGMTMLEVVFAIAVVGVAIMMQVQQVSMTLRELRDDQEVRFAERKAADMLAELQSDVDQGNIASIGDLMACDDAAPTPMLTTRNVPTPDHVMSGNSLGGDGEWTWWRDIDIVEVPGAHHSRFVRIAVQHMDAGGHRRLVATISGLINLVIRAEPRVQEYDVYALAIAEAPSLWLPLPELRAQLQSVADEVAGANPNLRFRLHWISKFGYGRDPLYTPFVNQAQRSDQAAPWVYAYPGSLPTSAGASTLYAAESIGGRVRTEAGVLHDFDAATNPFPYSVADRFNHCMRTPEAEQLFALRVAAGLEKADEPPLQLLLADMERAPERYENAIVLNLHGGLPVPPLRNYSDPAKDPAGHPGVRVVTHPARLHTLAGSGAAVEFRVYAYKTDPTAGAAVLDEPITLQIFGGDFRSSIIVERQEGGVDKQTGQVGTGLASDRRYAFGAATKIIGGEASAGAPFEMVYEVGYAATPQPCTWLRFHHTPLVCPVESGSGIDATARLYGTDYTPSPVWSSAGFYAMTNSTGTGVPKNSVRWRVQVPQSALQSAFGGRAVIAATTRIGTDLTTGRVWPTPNEPYNASTTYAWWSADPLDVPVTERWQFQGDPRHNPYFDLCVQGSTFSHGYNWWFDDFVDGASDWRSRWTCFDTARLRDGFGTGVQVDVPRFMQVWRSALERSHALFTNAGGRLGGFLLLGGEIALPPTIPGSTQRTVPVHPALYGGAGATALAVDELQVAAGTAGRGAPWIVAASGGFCARPWLGELWPDSAWTGWTTNGNLATASGFSRQSPGVVLPQRPFGTGLTSARGSELGDLGAASLFQSSSQQNAFVQPFASALTSGTLTDDAVALTRAVGIATSATCTARLPFTLRGTLSAALPQMADAARFPAQQLSLVDTLATSTSSGHTGAGVLRLAAPGTSDHAWFTVLGGTPTTASEHRQLVYKSLALSLRALFVAGEPARGDGVAQLPLLQILEPEPMTEFTSDGLLLRWEAPFVRFDAEPYTAGYPAAFAGDESRLVYTVTWQRPGETDWHALATDEVVVPGVLPAATSLWIVDAGTGSESLTLALPETRFPAGEYVLRVDAFLGPDAQHVTHHEVRVVRR